jgi:putative cell wall-binding protein
MAEPTPLRRPLVAVAAAVAVVLAFFAFPDARADQNAKSARLAGADRYETAVAISKAAFPTAGITLNAVIASGEAFPDALAASYLAGQVGGPILLVTRSEVPAVTTNELTRLGARNVWLVGGTGAIGTAVEDQLKATYTVKRIAGADRYETAADVATETSGTVGTYQNDKTAIVASGENYPDALAGGGVAYGKKFPLLLTQSTQLPAAAASALSTLAIKRVLLLGGTNAVSQSVEDAIKAKSITVQRVAGANRADTAAKVGELALSGLGFKNTEVAVASGNGYADALAGASYAGKNTVPILLMGSVPPETKAFVQAHNSTISLITAFGGVAAIPQADLDALTATARCQPATTTTTAPSLPLPTTTTTTGATTTTSATATSLPPCTTPTTAASTTTSSNPLPLPAGALLP